MKGFSLRTLMLATAGFAVLCGLFTSGGWGPTLTHLLLVLAFAIPAGSLAFDHRKTHRSAIIGTCVGAIVGTLLISLLVLAADLWLLTV